MVLNLAIIFILAAAGASPAPTPAPDACTADGHTALLAVLNRPTVGYSACAVKAHEVLVELGYANQSGDAPTVTYPQGFVRFGVGTGVELDFIGPAYQYGRSSGIVPGGSLDSGIGVKWEVAHDARGATGIDLLYTVPSGAAGVSAGMSTQTVNLDYARSISSVFGLAATLGVARGPAHGVILPSLVFSNQFNARTQWYAEAFAQSKTRPEGGALFGLDGGLQYLLAPRVEIDVEAGRTTTDRARNHFYGAGFGVRL